MYKIIALTTLLLFSYSGLQASYMLKPATRTKSRIDNMPKNRVGDMKQIPQDPAFYANQIKPFSKIKQEELDEEFNKKYFEPWSLKRLDIPKKDFGWEVRFVQKKPIYRDNGSVIASRIYNRWIINANYKKINSKKYRAITIRRTDVKALPT